MNAAPLGLVAGNGELPILFAQAARARNVPVVALALLGETRADLGEHVDVLHWLRLGQLGKMIRHFQRAGVEQAALAGGVPKTRLFSNLRPDWQGLRLLSSHLRRRDDDLLRGVADAFGAAGIQIIDSTALMPEVLTPAGVLSRIQPSAQQWGDLNEGLAMAHKIGALGVGQTVVVKDGAVVAMEAIEGTDACIRRAGELTGRRPAVVVKVAKPTQDMRFDVPVVGIETLAAMAAAGADVLGLEAGRTILLGPQKVLQEADRLGIALVGLEAPEAP